MPPHCVEQAPVPPPSNSRDQAQRSRALRLHALTLIQTLHPAFVVPLGRAGGASALSAALAQRSRRFSTHLPRRVFAAHRLAQNPMAAVPTWDVHD